MGNWVSTARRVLRDSALHTTDRVQLLSEDAMLSWNSGREISHAHDRSDPRRRPRHQAQQKKEPERGLQDIALSPSVMRFDELPPTLESKLRASLNLPRVSIPCAPILPLYRYGQSPPDGGDAGG